jgi:hypothetical protein
VIVEVHELVARNAVAPPLENDCAHQFDCRLTMVIPAHTGLDRTVQQAKEAGIGLGTAAAVLNLLAIPLGDSSKPGQGAFEDRDIIVGGWRRVDQVQN